jgi:hypothetical protein
MIYDFIVTNIVTKGKTRQQALRGWERFRKDSQDISILGLEKLCARNYT